MIRQPVCLDSEVSLTLTPGVLAATSSRSAAKAGCAPSSARNAHEIERMNNKESRTARPVMNAGPKGMIPARALWTGGSSPVFVLGVRRPRFVPQGWACREGRTSSGMKVVEEGLIRPVVERKECRVDIVSTKVSRASQRTDAAQRPARPSQSH